ncbi:hypothetical protein Scep_002152 [Stephania cephalantha]|uniref:Uncharacterized protein n=1 Tax=Stephania cephalantha TaxID=152367 RepID=A0AAP0Q8H5_9MAGN
MMEQSGMQISPFSSFSLMKCRSISTCFVQVMSQDSSNIDCRFVVARQPHRFISFNLQLSSKIFRSHNNSHTP